MSKLVALVTKIKTDSKKLIAKGMPVALVAALVVGFFLFVVGLVMGIYWIFWSLWLFVVPQLFPAAPEALQHPGYWLFMSAGFLVVWLRNLIFGITSKGKITNED